jgi:hypothetical protein
VDPSTEHCPELCPRSPWFHFLSRPSCPYFPPWPGAPVPARLMRSVPGCGPVQCSAVQCSAVPLSASSNSFSQHSAETFLSTSSEAQLTALDCTALYCIAPHCTALHYSTAAGDRCPAGNICAAKTRRLEEVPHCCTALCCTALHYAALHCTMLHCAALCCTALHYAALRCTALYCGLEERSVKPVDLLPRRGTKDHSPPAALDPPGRSLWRGGRAPPCRDTRADK